MSKYDACIGVWSHPGVALFDLLGHSNGWQSTQIDQQFPSRLQLSREWELEETLVLECQGR